MILPVAAAQRQRAARMRLVGRVYPFCAILFLAVSCRDASGPTGVIDPESMEAASDTSGVEVVGTVLPGFPRVLVKDANGNPLGGVTVTFAVTRGSSFISGQSVTTNPSGIAVLGTWALGTIPGINEVTASSGSLRPVKFQMSTVVGSPASIAMLTGDAQVAQAGGFVAVNPRVRVADRYDNPIAGVVVAFAILTGGGSLENPNARTDSSGVASSGAWRLGPRGSQVLAAQVPNLTPVSFAATVIAPILPCANDNVLLENTTVQAQLTSQSCAASDGRYYERVRIVIGQRGAYDFNLTSTDFDTWLELVGADPIAENDNRQQSNSGIKVLLVPQTYTLIISSTGPRVTGAYVVSFRRTDEMVDGCEEAFVMRGIVSEQLTTFSDCKISDWEQADRFKVYLRSGVPVSVHLDDLSYSDHGLSLWNPAGAIVALGSTPSSYRHTLTFTPTITGYYRIEVSNYGDGGAMYNITVN